MSSNALRELLAVFDIKVDDTELKAGVAKLDGFTEKLKKIGQVVAEAFAVDVVKEFFGEQIKGGAHIQDLADSFDVSAQAIKQFGFAAISAGVDIETAANALGFLQRNAGLAAIGTAANSAAFAQLGVKVRETNGGSRDLIGLLGDVAEGFSKLPNQQQRAAYAMQIFGREGRVLLPILSKGRDALVAMFAEARELGNGLGDEYFRNAKRAQEQSDKFSFALQSIKERITAAALPAITDMLSGLLDVAKAFLEFTKRTHVLTTAMEFIGGIVGVKLIKTLIWIGRALGLVKGTIWRTIRAFAGFAAPIAIAGALYLVFDDFWTMMHGGKSVIANLIDSFAGLGATKRFVSGLIDLFTDLVHVIGHAIMALAKLLGLVKRTKEKKPHVTTKQIEAQDAANEDAKKKLKAEAKAMKRPMTKAELKQQLADKATLHPQPKMNPLGLEGMPPEPVSDARRRLDAMNTQAQRDADDQARIEAVDDATDQYNKDMAADKADKKERKGHKAPPAGQVATVPSGSMPWMGGDLSAPVVLHQTNQTTVNVKTAHDDPKGVGNAAGAGVANEHQKNMNAALKSVVRK